MKEYQSLSLTRWDCKYHIVFIPKLDKKFRKKNIAAEIYPSPLDLHLSTVNQRADLHENWKIKYAESLAALPNPARKTKRRLY